MSKLDDWLQQRGGIQTSTKHLKKKLTTRERFERALEKQVRIANGDEILNTKGAPIRSWFKDGRFSPKIGVYSLLKSGEYISYNKGEEISVINQFVQFFNNRDLDIWIENLDIKITQSKREREVKTPDKDNELVTQNNQPGIHDSNLATAAALKNPQEYLAR
jgi:hypothetical protein